MGRLFVLISLVFCLQSHASEPWKLNLIDRGENIVLKVDLQEESIMVPGMEMFGPMHGYLGGNVYGVWTITSFKLKKDRAVLRMSNDLGSETQEAELTQSNDSTYTLKLVGTVVVKRAAGNRLHKIASTLRMVRSSR